MALYIKVQSDGRFKLPTPVNQLFEPKCLQVSWDKNGIILKQVDPSLVPEDILEETEKPP